MAPFPVLLIALLKERIEVLTRYKEFDSIYMQHKKSVNDNNFVPEEGQRDFLCCNKKSFRCPSLDSYPNTSEMPKEVALDYLAAILVKIFISLENDEYTSRNNKEGGALLPSLDKGTSRGRQ